jgi:hypothetical protein
MLPNVVRQGRERRFNIWIESIYALIEQTINKRHMELELEGCFGEIGTDKSGASALFSGVNICTCNVNLLRKKAHDKRLLPLRKLVLLHHLDGALGDIGA